MRENLPAHLSNTEEFISRLRQAFPEGLPPGSLLFTMDIAALYSNIPIEEGIQTALDLVKEHQDEIDTIGFELRELENLLRFVLKNNCFRFGKNFYQQKMGVAMGNRLAPPFAILFMHTAWRQDI